VKRVLLVGGSGQLGAEIRKRWGDCDVVAPAHAVLDLEDDAAIARAFDERRPEVVVNAAAFHNVDRCEQEVDRAFAVNALAVERLASKCARDDVLFVTISTDYVFNGEATHPYDETDAAHPISAYGTSKLAGEFLTLRLQSRAFVVRTCGLYGVRPSQSKGHTFIDRVITQARTGEPVHVVDNVTASPTYAGHLAQTLRALIETNAYGLYHACNVGPVTWFDFAAEALRQAGIAQRPEPISSSQWKAAARRPRYSALANTALTRIGIMLPTWQEGIAAYLHDRTTDALDDARERRVP